MPAAGGGGTTNISTGKRDTQSVIREVQGARDPWWGVGVCSGHDHGQGMRRVGMVF